MVAMIAAVGERHGRMRPLSRLSDPTWSAIGSLLSGTTRAQNGLTEQRRLGPSFSSPSPRDRLAGFMCSSPDLRGQYRGNAGYADTTLKPFTFRHPHRHHHRRRRRLDRLVPLSLPGWTEAPRPGACRPQR